MLEEDVASRELESAPGADTGEHGVGWVNDDDHYSVSVIENLSPHPNVWSYGSLVRDDISGVCAAGAGVFARLSGASWFLTHWVTWFDGCCSLFCSIPGPLQTAQRAER